MLILLSAMLLYITTVNRGYFVHRGNFEHHGVTLYAFSKHITIFSKHKFLLLLLFTRPLTRDGGMAEYHGAPEAEQLPRVWTRGRKEIDSRQRVRAQRVCSWTVQNEMSGVLGQVSIVAAGRILDSANPREIRT